MNPNQFQKLALPSLALLLVGAVPAAAQETPPPDAAAPDDAVQLAELAIVAEREPGNFLLGSEDISKLQASDLSQLLSNQSSLAVGGGAPVAQKIYVRGFEDVLLNVTIDGAQQAGELYHHQGRVQLEPEFIESIQLDAGAGTATAGAGALTGALAVTTRDATDLLAPGQRFGARIRGTYAINGDDSTQGVLMVYGAPTENTGIVVGVARQEGEDYEDGNGDIVAPTAFEHERAYIKANGRFGEHEMALAYESVSDSGTYYERPNFWNFTGTYVLSDHDLQRDTLTYNHRFDAASELVDIRGTFYVTENQFENHRNTTGALYGKGDFTSVGVDLRNTSVFGSHAATYGVEYRFDDSYGAQQATPPAFWGFSRQTAEVFGLYAQDNWDVTDAVQLSAGVRFDSYSHDVDEGVSAGVSNDDSGVSPNISAEWEIVSGLSVRAAYAQSFRGITIRESFFSALYRHDGTLESEKADNLEFGASYERDGYFARATIYQQTIENYINAVFTGPPAWGYWRNTGDAEVDGYEVEIGRRWRTVTTAVGVWNTDNTYNDRAMTDADLGLGTSIGRTWTARVDWALPKQRADFALRARLVEDEPNEISATAPDKDGYFVADLHASWRPLADTPLTFQLSINNVFDEFYYDQATYSYHAGSGRYIGFPAKGREFVLSASYQF
ncbi:MAG: TonB-dependent receptor [Opitutaceae bacterium]|nr:TonB-dependent receptor [Opitutaceae bacterium]